MNKIKYTSFFIEVTNIFLTYSDFFLNFGKNNILETELFLLNNIHGAYEPEEIY